MPRDEAPGIGEAEREGEPPLEQRPCRLPDESPDPDQLERVPGAGDELGLDPPGGSDEDDRGLWAPSAELARQRQRREDVASGAAARDQVSAARSARALHGACCERLRRIPTARRSAQSADPP